MSTSSKRMAPLLEALQCGRPVRFEYDSAASTGTIHMPPDCCTDMPAAIRLFTLIDPEVRTILTYAGHVANFTSSVCPFRVSAPARSRQRGDGRQAFSALASMVPWESHRQGFLIAPSMKQREGRIVCG